MKRFLILLLTAFIFTSFTVSTTDNINVICRTGDFLFSHCKTEVRISAPGIPAGDLSYTCDGCRIFPGGSPETIILYADSYKMIYNKPVVRLNVLVKNQIVTSKEFQSLVPPLPQVELYSDTKRINMKQGESAETLNKIQMVIQPEPMFSAMFPDEDSYEIRTADLILVRGKRPINTGSYKNKDFDVSGWYRQPGDRFLLDIKELTRTTSAGDKIPVTFNGLYNICLY